jgi:hypothetical protein
MTNKCRYDLKNIELSLSITRKRPQTKTTGERTRTTVYKERPSSKRWIIPSIVTSSPLDVTPLPRAIPPIAKKTIVQANCSKSSLRTMLVGKSIANLITTHLFQYASCKKGDNRDDGNNAHVSNKTFDFVLNTPESDRGQADKSDPILLQGE